MEVLRCRFYHPAAYPIDAVEFDHAEKLLAVGRSHHVEVWDSGTLHLLHSAPLPKKSSRCLLWLGAAEVASEGNRKRRRGERPRLVVAGLHGEVVLFSDELEKLASAPAYGGAIWALASVTAKDGSRQIAAASDSGKVLLFDDTTLDLVRSLVVSPTRVLSLAVESGFLFVGGSDSGISRLSLQDMQSDTRMAVEGQGTLVWALLGLGDGTLASGDSAGHVTRWDAIMGTRLQRLGTHQAEVLTLARSPSGKIDGPCLYSAGTDRKISVFQQTTEQSGESSWEFHNALFGHTHDVRALASGSGHLVSGGPDGSLHIWPERGAPTKLPPFVPRARVQLQGRLLTALQPQQVELWYLKASRGESIWEVEKGWNGIHGGALLSQSLAGALLPSPVKLATVRLDDDCQIVASALAPEGTVLAVAGTTGLRAFAIDLNEVELRSLECPRLAATALAFAPKKGAFGLWVGEGKTLRYCDAKPESGVASRWSAKIEDVVSDIRVSAQYVVAVSRRHVTVFDANTREEVWTSPKVSGYLTAVDFIGAERIAVATTTHSVLLLDVKAGGQRRLQVPDGTLSASARICGILGVTDAKLLLWTADALVKVNLDQLPEEPEEPQATGSAGALAPFFQDAATAWQVERRFKWIVGLCPLGDLPECKVNRTVCSKALLCELTPADYARSLAAPFERKQYGN